MVFLEFVEMALTVAFLFFVVTQFVIPLWKGTRLLPVLRSTRKRQLIMELSRIKEEEEEVRLQQQITEEKHRVEQLRHRPPTTSVPVRLIEQHVSKDEHTERNPS